MTILEEYNSRIEDLSEFGGEILIYAFGSEEAEIIMSRAIKSNQYAEVVYADNVDEIEGVLYKPVKQK